MVELNSNKVEWTIDIINIAPVKSLGLLHPNLVHVGESGIEEDRRFHVVDGKGGLITQRQISKLVQVKVEYSTEPEHLVLIFPDGSRSESIPETGNPEKTLMFGRMVSGCEVVGDFGQALSHFCGVPLRLIKSDIPCQSYDGYPVSIISQASIDQLSRESRMSKALDNRRFRPNFLIEGPKGHEEDLWLGKDLGIGADLTLRVNARDPRCVITTQDPDTGERDMDTLRAILSYRPDPKAAYFGVYGDVQSPGLVRIGDKVTLHNT